PRQREIFEEILHELFTGDLKDELVFSLAILARLRAATTGPAAFGSWNAIPAQEFLVARMHDLAGASGSMAEHGLGNVAPRDDDAFTLCDVADASPADRPADGVADLIAVATQEPLAVANRFVLAGEATIDDLLQHFHSGSTPLPSVFRDRATPGRFASARWVDHAARMNSHL